MNEGCLPTLSWEPVSGFEPLACRLQEVRPRAPNALAAQITRIIALMALTALGLPGEPFHEPFHDPPQRPLRSVTMRRARAPLPGAADNGGAPNGLRAQNGSVCHVMACPGFGQDYRT